MRFAEEERSGPFYIRSYGPGRIIVNEKVVCSSCIITPEQLIEDWQPTRFDEIESSHVEALAAMAPEIILLGTGADLKMPDPAITTPPLERGIGVEVMATPALCRTYNILAAEGRRVVAGILMIE